MKCTKCHSEIKEYENNKYCGQCGYPVNVPISDGTNKLHSVYFDADLGTLFVNGIRFEKVMSFSLMCNAGKSSLVVSRDEEFKKELP